MKRRIYVKSQSLKEALKVWSEYIASLPYSDIEEIPVSESLHRVTAEAVSAHISSPFYHASAMDGYAVRFEDTHGASETTPVKLKLGEQAVPVNTGNPLPEGFNAVVMVEDVHQEGDYIIINESLTPYQNVRTVGEDIVQTELILPENHLIRPVDIAALLAGGHTRVKVRRKPVVGVIPTGDEVVEPGSPLKPGNIIEFNSRMISSMTALWGGECRRESITSDSKEILKDKAINLLNYCDFLVIIAGSSVGTKDHTPELLGDLGEVLVHGVNIKPGKPVILASINGKPVMGLPGYPVSAYITYELFARPLIYHLQGLKPPSSKLIKARLSRPVYSSLGQTEFLRVKVGKVAGEFVASPVGRGAGAIMTVQRADGIVEIPEGSEGFAQNEEVTVRLLRSEEEIENTIVCIGSHDNCLDLMANFLKKRHPLYSLSSAHLGSMGGIVAIRQSQAHIAGTHLLDEATGEYNIPYIKRLLKDVPLVLINLVYRMQGFIVKKGNPKNIQSVEDLLRDDITFINRQAGSGTRVLTDKLLRERDIDPSRIKGYNREEYTHMGIASAVATGVADVGVGILTAAQALGLDFIPIAKERYDLIIPKEHLERPMIKALLDIIRNDTDFHKAILDSGGYDISDIGKVIYEQ
ncbi:MAG: molybdopterin biosynthesis protein [Nitrospirae bacterium]|nr:molybdopterin biosynthesis protein [Nitrospirota bacterium]